MFGVLLLLLLYQSTAESTTITQTKRGWGAFYPWPASGKIKIRSTCSAGLPGVNLRFYRGGSWGGAIYWSTNDNQLRIYCTDAAPYYTEYPFTHDFGGGYVTLTIQLTADEMQVWNKGVKIAGITRDGRCGEQPDQWRIYLYSGSVTATDGG